MKQVLMLSLLIFNIKIIIGQLIVNPSGSLNYPRWQHESQVLPNGNVLAFGGDNGNFSSNIVYQSSEAYNPATNTWVNKANMNVQRTVFSSAILNDGKILAIGGHDQNLNMLSSCEVYDYVSNTWTQVTPMNEPRQGHKSVKLKDGRVLVVGGNSSLNRAEIYDPYSNNWQYSDTLNKRHGQGISVVLLNDGRVLLTGGTNSPNTAEIFNPISNAWTLIANTLNYARSYHNSVVLATGNVAITAGDATQKRTEIFNVSTNSFSTSGSLLTNVGDCKTILMDDGKALIHCIGDFTAPGNTKCLEIFGGSTWTTGAYSFLGANDYGINKLNNGRILINGGSATTGNGANVSGLLIGSNSFSNCVAPDLTSALTTVNVCYGKTPTVTITSSESNVMYSASIGGIVASNSAVGTTGSSLSLPLFANMIQPGNNVVSIIANKWGCPLYSLNNLATVNASLSITATPTLNYSGTVYICTNDSIQLSTSSGYPAYIWSNLSSTVTASSIYVKPTKLVTVKYSDANGCTSIPSPLVRVYTPTTAYAGPQLTVCANSPAMQLTGNTPPGGTWSGSGVSPSGVFDPGITGAGSFTVTYSYCAKVGTRVIKVNPITVPSYSAAFTASMVCPNQTATLQVTNSSIGVKYQLRNGTVNIGSPQTGTGGLLSLSTGSLSSNTTYNLLATINSGCTTDTLITYHTMQVKPSLNANLYALNPIVCRGQKTLIIVDNSQIGVNYQVLNSFGSTIGTGKYGDGDTIAFQVGPINTYTTFGMKFFYNGCGFYTSTIHPTVNIEDPEPYFAPNKFNVSPGEYVKFDNNSFNPAGSYSWNFGTGASILTSTLSSPDSVVYASPGSYDVSLKVSSPIGCKDSLKYRINVFDLDPPQTCDAARSTFNNVNCFPMSVANDKDDNTYLYDYISNSYSAAAFSKYNDTIKHVFPYSQSYDEGHSLTKYSRNGVPLWKVKIRHESGWADPGNMDVDSAGNVYLTYFHGEYLDSIHFHSVDNSHYSIDPPHSGSTFQSVIICKYNSQGYFQWARTYLEPYWTNYAIVKVDNRHACLYAGSEQTYRKYDLNGNPAWTYTISTPGPAIRGLDVDNAGNMYLAKGYNMQVEKYDPSGNYISITAAPTTTALNSFGPGPLKIDNNNAYTTGTMDANFGFANDTFLINKPYSDCYLASYNIVTGQQKWCVQMKTRNNEMRVMGLDYKNGRGTISGYIYISNNDTITVKNLILPMKKSGYFCFNFDSLGNIYNLNKLSSHQYNFSFQLDLVAANNLNNDATIAFMFSDTLQYGTTTYKPVANNRNVIVLKNDINCLSGIATSGQNKIESQGHNNSLLIYPNPLNSDQDLTISIISERQVASSITIYDIMGKEVGVRQTINLVYGDNQFVIPKESVNNLKAGTYFLKLTSKSLNNTVKLIIF